MTAIRPERPGDEPAIRAVLVDAFPTDAEARLVELLREAEHLSVSLVAECDGEVVGHVGFSPVSTGAGAIGAGLAPIAVRGSHRRRGIGGMLIALRCRHQFGRLVALGISCNFFLYVFVNIAMVMGVIPVGGVPLPLVSHGGSAMLTVMVGFGVLMSVHVHRDVEFPTTREDG